MFNTGFESSTKAAAPIDAKVAKPELGGRKCDAWDLYNEQGADGIKAMIEAATAPTFATFAVAEPEKRTNIIDYDLDGAPEDIQRLRSCMASIPSSVTHGKHTASALIGYALRHTDSGVDTAIGAALSSEWDSRYGGNSFETFSTCDPNYSLSSPVTTASIFDLGKKSGWDGQAPWPEPEPLISHSEALPYPMEALPEIIREAVREVVDYSQVPVALAACSAMSAVSTVVQSFVDVQRDNMLEGPVGLYTLAIAESGERKSTVDGYFTKTILEWEKEINEQYKPILQEHAANLEAWEATKSGLVTSIKEKVKKGQDVSKEREDLAKLNSEAPVAPIVPRLLYGDTTPEKINRNLSTGWPVAGIISSEAGIIFGGHAMGKDSSMRNMATLNVFWDGWTNRTDRQTSDSYSGRPARATMGLAVQAETVRSFLEASKGLARGIGFLARFLIAWPESTQGYRPYKKSADSWPALDAFSERITALLHCRPPIDEQGNITPTVLTLGKDAFELWVSFYNDVEAELRPGRSMNDAKDIASKSADNAARLAGLFHFFGGALPGEPIGNETIGAACAIAEWHLFEAKRFLGEIALPVEISNAVKLDQWLLATCKDKGESSMATGYAQRYAPNRLRSKPTFDAATQVLIEFGRARILRVGKKKVLEVNPSLLEGK
jgi:putative DNA primase/helicase